MIVYKFGGASVKDAEGIRNLRRIVSSEKQNLVVVISAFGKTTNFLEKILKEWIGGEKVYSDHLSELYNFHSSVIDSLSADQDSFKATLDQSFSLLKDYLSETNPGKYDFEYDQVVSFGEIWSTLIVSEFLKRSGLKAEWIDIREYLITDDRFRDANVLWSESGDRIKEVMDFDRCPVYLTQGFIGGTLAGETTTLGREGSDYTAAIIGNILDADKVVFWKDVSGILNADPKWLSEVTRLDNISYKEAVEMTFSGAKIIHPKSIKPLHNKGIPLEVRSFQDPEGNGTVIKADAGPEERLPIFVRKENQILVSILPKDLSFVMGDHLSRVFHSFMVNGVKVNLVQASAVSINVCVDNEPPEISSLIHDLEKDFKTAYNDDVEVLTIRHYTPQAIGMITAGRDILLEQRTRKTVRFVVKKIM
jgi:aspartate kinase